MTKKQKTRARESGQVVRIVKKSNELVEARYKFDIWETRLFTKMLTMVTRDDEDFKDYRIYLSDIVKEFGLEKSNASYERLKMGGIKLMSKIIKVVRETEDGMMEFSTPIVVGVDNPLNPEPGDGEFIDVSFHPKMKPFLLALQSKFTMYDVRNILKLPSTYSIRIYELLKQYEKIGKRRFELEELKRIIGVMEEKTEKGKIVLEDHYPLYGNFRQRVLLKAQKDLSEYTDIRFTFDPIKKSRKVRGVIFYIAPNEPKRRDDKKKSNRGERESSQEETHTGDTPQNVIVELLPKVSSWGVTESTLEQWIESYGVQQVQRAIIYTQSEVSKKNIENPAGYLATMVKQAGFFDPEEAKREKKKKVAERKAKREELTAQLEELEEAYSSGLNEKIRSLVSEDSEANDKTLQSIKDTANMMVSHRLRKLNLSIDDLTVQLCRDDRILRGVFKATMMNLYADYFADLVQKYNPQIIALREEIKTLK